MILYKFRRKIIKKIKAIFFKQMFVKGFYKNDLLIYDDIFPHPISGFRYEEFKTLLNVFKKSKIIVEPISYPALKTEVKVHKIHILEFKSKFPELENKFIQKKTIVNINAKLFYCVFLSNIYRNLVWLEKYKIPFVFTLYPGGGFQVEDLISDQQLQKVLASPQFRKVIVTQSYTRDYLLNNNFCSADKIEYIFGCVVPQQSIKKSIDDKKLFLRGKNTLDICFCAAKYMPKGLDKGYDVFIEMAISIVKKYDFIRIHVIGGFDKHDIDVTLLDDKISFYGYQSFENLASIYKNMDIIISPNKPFYLGKGFDGFPLGTVIEAVFNGVVALVTDKLKQNTVFVNDEEIIIIESSAELIEKEIIKLITNSEKLYSLSRKGNEKFKEIFSNDFQMKPRVALLHQIITEI